MLSAWPGAEGIADVHFAIWQTLDFGLFGERQDGYGNHRGLLAIAAFGGRDALDAMLAGFVLKGSPYVLAADFGCDVADAGVKDLDLERLLSGVLRVGREQFAYEDAGVLAAFSRLDVENEFSGCGMAKDSLIGQLTGAGRHG